MPVLAYRLKCPEHRASVHQRLGGLDGLDEFLAGSPPPFFPKRRLAVSGDRLLLLCLRTEIGLTLEAQKRVEASPLSKREIIRRLGTSATQFYRLLDQTNTTKSVGQLLSLLHVLDCDVDLVVRDRRTA